MMEAEPFKDNHLVGGGGDSGFCSHARCYLHLDLEYESFALVLLVQILTILNLTLVSSPSFTSSLLT